MRETAILTARGWTGVGPFYQTLAFKEPVMDGTVKAIQGASEKQARAFTDGSIQVSTINGWLVTFKATTNKPIVNIPIEFTYNLHATESLEAITVVGTKTSSTTFSGTVTKEAFSKLKEGNVPLIVSILDSTTKGTSMAIKMPSYTYDVSSDTVSALAPIIPTAGSSLNFWGVLIKGTDLSVSGFVSAGGGGGSASVSWDQIVTTGTKIGQITINGVTTEVFAPGLKQIPIEVTSVAPDTTFTGTKAITPQERLELFSGQATLLISMKTSANVTQVVSFANLSKIDANAAIISFVASDFGTVPKSIHYEGTLTYDTTGFVLSATITKKDIYAEKTYVNTELNKKVDKEMVNGDLEGTLQNDGNLIYAYIMENEEDRSVFTMGREEIDQVVRNGADKTEILQDVNKIYYKKNNEVGSMKKPGQEIARKDDIYEEVTATYNGTTHAISGTVTQAQFDSIKTGKMVKISVTSGGSPYCTLLATPYFNNGDNVISCIGVAKDASGNRVPIIFVKILSTLALEGVQMLVGNTISTSATPYGGGTEIHGITLNGTEYNLPSGGGSDPLVAITVEKDESSQILSGTVTQAQYDSLKAGGKLAKVEVQVSGVTVERAVGTAYYNLSTEQIVCACVCSYSPGKAEIVYLGIRSNLNVSGNISSVGHSMEFSSEAYSVATEIKGMTIDGEPYNFMAAGGAQLVEFDVSLDATTQTFSGTVTEEQYVKLASGALARVTIFADSTIVAYHVGGMYLEPTSGTLVALAVVQCLSSSLRADIAYITIANDYSITGYIGKLGNDIAFSNAAVTGGQIVRSVNLNGDDMNFPETILEDAMSESSDNGVKNKIIKAYVDAIINDTLESDTTTWSSNSLKSKFQALTNLASIKVVATKPETGELNTLYYVGSTSPYTIWLYANDSSTPPVPTWYEMGTTEIDLTQYYTKTEADARFLKLSGGVMTGVIKTNSNTMLARNVDNDFCIYCGGTSSANGPQLKFYGKDCTGDKAPFAGCFQLIVNKGSGYQWMLQGLSNGVLTWGRWDGSDTRQFLLAGDATKVVGYTTAQTGASDLKSIDIGGTKYNIPSGGAGSISYVDFNVDYDETTGALSGTVTDEVYTKLISGDYVARMSFISGEPVSRTICSLVTTDSDNVATMCFNIESDGSGLILGVVHVGSTKAIEGEVITTGGGGAAEWGAITGDLADQTDLQEALDAKQGTITSGVADPDPSSGEDGDVYIKEGDNPISEIHMNGSAVSVTGGVADLGTVIVDVTGKQNKITYGSEDPTGGVDGDIYIKYAA